MDWFREIDIYCERVTPVFWDEPLNAVSNAAFIIAAAAAATHVARHDAAKSDRPLWALTVLVAVIGTGSFLFHTFANFWSLLADVIPISIFIYAYLGYALRRYLNAGWIVTLPVVLVFAAGSFGLDSVVPAHVLNGSVGYLPALGAIFVLAALTHARNHPVARSLLLAGLIFTVSLVFRSIDNAICASLPIGVHYIWHCLNALLLYVLLHAAADHGRRGAAQTATADA